MLRQFDAHLPMCRHVSQVDNHVQCDPASQTVLSGTLSQYTVYTSGQQQFLSPVFLLSSDESSPATSAAIQLVPFASSDSSITDSLQLNLTNACDSIKSDPAAADYKLTNDSAYLGGDRLLNGPRKSDSAIREGVSEALLAAVDAHTESCNAVATDTKNTKGGIQSVPVSPVTKAVHNTRRRRSMSALSSNSEPTVKVPRRTSLRHVSTDRPLAKKAAPESDNLPLFLSTMTGDD